MSHLPVTSLFTRTTGGLRRLDGVLMEIQRQIAANESHLAGLDICRLELLEGFHVKVATEGALVVCEFDQRDRRILTAERVGMVHRDLRLLRWRYWSRRRKCVHTVLPNLLLQQCADLLELLQNGFTLFLCHRTGLCRGGHHAYEIQN